MTGLTYPGISVFLYGSTIFCPFSFAVINIPTPGSRAASSRLIESQLKRMFRSMARSSTTVQNLPLRHAAFVPFRGSPTHGPICSQPHGRSRSPLFTHTPAPSAARQAESLKLQEYIRVLESENSRLATAVSARTDAPAAHLGTLSADVSLDDRVWQPRAELGAILVLIRVGIQSQLEDPMGRSFSPWAGPLPPPGGGGSAQQMTGSQPAAFSRSLAPSPIDLHWTRSYRTLIEGWCSICFPHPSTPCGRRRLFPPGALKNPCAHLASFHGRTCA